MAVRKTILIIDDEKDSADLIRGILEAEDSYRIFTVYNGSDAYAKIKNINIDLIITDQVMPKMTGTELYELVRSSRLHANIPFLIVSAAIDEVVKKVKREPLLEFLGKPFQSQTLTETVRSLLQRREKVLESGVPLENKPHVDVAIMNEFITATKSTLAHMTNLTKIENGPIQPAEKQIEQIPRVSGMINMNCQKFTGSLIVSFPGSTILQIHNRLLDETKQKIDIEVADTVGELINIIWGRTRKLLESEHLAFTSSIPVVFEETKKYFHSNSRRTTLTVPFHTEIGDLDILFSINY